MHGSAIEFGSDETSNKPPQPLRYRSLQFLQVNSIIIILTYEPTYVSNLGTSLISMR